MTTFLFQNHIFSMPSCFIIIYRKIISDHSTYKKKNPIKDFAASVIFDEDHERA